MRRAFSAVQVLGVPDFGIHECLRLAVVVGAADRPETAWLATSSRDRLVAAFGPVVGDRMHQNGLELFKTFSHMRDGASSRAGAAVVTDWATSYPDKGTSIRFLPPILVEAESLEEAAYFLTFDLPEPSLRSPAPASLARSVGEEPAPYEG